MGILLGMILVIVGLNFLLLCGLYQRLDERESVERERRLGAALESRWPGRYAGELDAINAVKRAHLVDGLLRG